LYYVVAILLILSDGIEEFYPVYNPNIFFLEKEKCEKYLEENNSFLRRSIENYLQYVPEIKLREVVTIKCMTNGKKI